MSSSDPSFIDDFAASYSVLLYRSPGGGTPLALLEQRETAAGASSLFPSYDAGTGRLVAITNAGNSSEASIFDASGLSTIDVDFANGSSTSGSFLAVALPITPVPGLDAWRRALLLLGLLAVVVLKESRRGLALTEDNA